MHNPSWLGTIVERLPDGKGKIITHNHYNDLTTNYYMFASSNGRNWRKVEASQVEDNPIGPQTREIIIPNDTMDYFHPVVGTEEGMEKDPIPIPLGTPIPGGMTSTPSLSPGDPAAIAYLAPSGFGGNHVEVFHGNVWGAWKVGEQSVAFVSSGTAPGFADSGDSGGGLFMNGQHCGNAWEKTGPYYGQYGWIFALNP